MQGTFWALLPPLAAIVLALITKEVYVSLFIGILTGALFYSGFDILKTIDTTFFAMTESVYGKGTNIRIIIFLVLLGTIVSLVNKSGGSMAFGHWAGNKIKTERSAKLSTLAFALMLFIDDYFICLTTGNVMRPITDRNRVSRAKLAYIVDSTAVPICILAPLSSWAAAVASSLSESGATDGFQFFIKTIPYNLYAILTILMVFTTSMFNIDFSSMLKHENNAQNGDLFTSKGEDNFEEEPIINSKGKVIDLIIPIITLIGGCIFGLLYTGGILSGASVFEAFSHCESSRGLLIGAFIALIVTFILYIPRKVISFKEFIASLPSGFKEMSSAIIVLSMAWTLGNITEKYMKAGEFISSLIGNNTSSIIFIPVIMFVLSVVLSFSTGTSWGTFAMLIPISFPLFAVNNELLVITIAAVLAGSTCGDHVSPISDTMIMSSAGTKCNLINHVTTQFPYALLVASISAVGYVIAGFVKNPIIVLLCAVTLLLIILFSIKYRQKTATQKSRVE
ncbi:MAG: Na+/H+ antiporter NhaC [Eubacteriales bacterium SKADARSKE-1]|nr:Na+/H+ antiporter NhaC [Eubacteriales bacterium SKADARSKE-1]